jgi:hypothetical protein
MNAREMEPQRHQDDPENDGDRLDSAQESPLLECPACRRVVGELSDWKVVPASWLLVSSRVGLCSRHGEGGGTG